MKKTPKKPGEISEVAVPYLSRTFFTDELTFSDKEGKRMERILIAEISLPSFRADGANNNKTLRNARANISAIDYHETATSLWSPIPEDNAPLKWSGLPNSIPRDILPGMTVGLDILAIRKDEPGIFLHTQQDVIPRKSICAGTGEYGIHVVVHSDNYPPLEFVAKFDYYIEQTVGVVDAEDEE